MSRLVPRFPYSNVWSACRAKEGNLHRLSILIPNEFAVCVNLTYNSGNFSKLGVTAMSETTINESARINLRTSADAKAMIERAAALMGTTVSGFMLQNAYEAARRVVSDYDTLMLSQRDFEAFASSMEKPPKPKAALKKIMARR